MEGADFRAVAWPPWGALSEDKSCRRVLERELHQRAQSSAVRRGKGSAGPKLETRGDILDLKEMERLYIRQHSGSA